MPVIQKLLEILEAMELKTIPSSLSIQDGEVKEMPTMEIQIEREMMTPEGQREVPTQEDHQVVMIQMITLMAVKMMTLQAVMATRYQAAVTCITH